MTCRACPSRRNAESAIGRRSACHSRIDSRGKECNIRQPRSEHGADPALPRQRHSDQRNEVVNENQSDGEDETARLAAFLRRKAQRNSDHRQHQAGRGKREAAVKFDQVPARRYGIDAAGIIAQRPCAHESNRDWFICLVFRRRQFEGNVSLLKGGDLVMIGQLGIGFVSGTID